MALYENQRGVCKTRKILYPRKNVSVSLRFFCDVNSKAIWHRLSTRRTNPVVLSSTQYSNKFRIFRVCTSTEPHMYVHTYTCRIMVCLSSLKQVVCYCSCLNLVCSGGRRSFLHSARRARPLSTLQESFQLHTHSSWRQSGSRQR